jgi:hypothetical protein
MVDNTNCQNFKFSWQLSPSLSTGYKVEVEKNDSRSFILIKETYSLDSIKKEMGKEDCDALEMFLDKYDFPTRGSKVYGPIIREYAETEILSDTNWIVVNGDSIRKELLFAYGYFFDYTLNQCYTENRSVDIWTDGHTYEGEYSKLYPKKVYSVYCERVSALDCELNNMIYRLIIKYDSKNNYKQLKRFIDSDKPKM